MFVSANARVVTDNTGAATEIPVLLSPAGVLHPLLDYCLAHSHDRSISWMRKLIHAVTLFLKYLQSNPEQHDTYRLFQNFAQRLYTGTFDRTSGLDLSGLCWERRSPQSAREIIGQLTDFFEWLGKERPRAKEVNPRYSVGAFDRRMDEAAYLFRREKAFLGHTWATNAGPSDAGHRIRAKREPSVAKGEPPAFPEDRFEELLVKGFKVGGDYDYRGMLITLLMHGAGVRVSEPFHLYLADVVPDPFNPKSALVLIHHPSHGDAPSDWTDQTGRKRTGDRATYLAEKFALAARTELLGNRGAGWKNPRLDNKFYMRAYWFQPYYGEWFLALWQMYLQRVNLLKSQTQITIDQRPLGATVAKESGSVPVLLMDAQLTDSECTALTRAISSKFLADEGWREGSHGEIKNKSGRTIFEVGFTSAIRKALGKG